MGGHSNWPEWIYVGVIVALMFWVGAEAWIVESGLPSADAHPPAASGGLPLPHIRLRRPSPSVPAACDRSRRPCIAHGETVSGK